MNVLAAVALFFAVAVVVSAEGDKYSAEFDNIDVDEILNNDRLRKNYYQCLKTGEKCTKAGSALRGILPEALQTDCAKCSEVQKAQAKKIIYYMIKNFPEEFKVLESQFDSEHKYITLHGEEIKKEGLKIPK